MFQRPFLFLTGLCAALAAENAAAQSSLFAVTDTSSVLRVIDPANGNDIDTSRNLSLAGFTVASGHGLARHPATYELYALIKLSDQSQRVVTVDEVTGACTIVTSVQPDIFSDIAFDNQGTLYAVSGEVFGLIGVANPGQLYALSGGVWTFTLSMTNTNNNAHAIGWNPEQGLMLHNAGGFDGASGVWEYIGLQFSTITALPAGGPSSDPHNRVTGLLYAGADQFFMSEFAGTLRSVGATTPLVTLLGGSATLDGLATGPNDDCANALPVSTGSIMGSLDGATNDATGTCGISAASPDVWYRFHAENVGTLSVSTCGTHDLPGVDLGVDTALAIWDGCPLEGGVEIGCNDDAQNNECSGVDAGLGRDSALSVPMQPGQEVWIRVTNFNNGATGPFVLNLSFARTNTLCVDGLVLSGSGTETGSLLGASQDAVASCDGNGSGTVDGWFRYTAVTDGTLNLNTCGTFDLSGPGQGMDTILAVYTDCAGLELACNDDNMICANGNPVTRDSAVMVTMLQGEEVRIRVANYSSPSFTSTPGPFVLNYEFTRANDTCDTAAPITEGNYMFDLASSTVTAGVSCQDTDDDDDGDIWFEYTASEDGLLEVDTCGSGALSFTNTILGLYASCADIGLTGEIDCNDNALNGPCSGGVDSYVSSQLTAGESVLILATRKGGLPGNSDFILNVNFTPKFENFCNGDGGPTPGCTNCPCGNNAPPGTIGGCFNSVGESARLEGSGDPSVGIDTMRFEMRGGNPNTFAILSSGPARAPANAVNPCFGTGSGVQSPVFNGLRCVVSGGMGPVQRHGTRPTDNLGNVGVSNNGWGFGSGPPGGLINQGGFIAGQTRHYQVIYREMPFAACFATQNTSQGVTVTFTN